MENNEAEPEPVEPIEIIMDSSNLLELAAHDDQVGVLHGTAPSIIFVFNLGVDSEVGQGEMVEMEPPQQSTSSSPPPPPQPRRRQNTRKQTLIPRLEKVVKRNAAAKKRKRKEKLYEKDASDPEIDQKERNRRRKAKKDREFRVKKNSALENAETQLEDLRDQLEKQIRKTEILQGELTKIMTMDMTEKDWDTITGESIGDFML